MECSWWVFYCFFLESRCSCFGFVGYDGLGGGVWVCVEYVLCVFWWWVLVCCGLCVCGCFFWKWEGWMEEVWVWWKLCLWCVVLWWIIRILFMMFFLIFMGGGWWFVLVIKVLRCVWNFWVGLCLEGGGVGMCVFCCLSWGMGVCKWGLFLILRCVVMYEVWSLG